jgi:hypothetical protein
VESSAGYSQTSPHRLVCIRKILRLVNEINGIIRILKQTAVSFLAVRQLLIGRVDGIHHAVEGLRQEANFIVELHRHADGQVAAIDLFDAIHQRFERPDQVRPEKEGEKSARLRPCCQHHDHDRQAIGIDSVPVHSVGDTEAVEAVIPLKRVDQMTVIKTPIIKDRFPTGKIHV